MPVACQSREVTEPQRELARPKVVTEGLSPRKVRNSIRAAGTPHLLLPAAASSGRMRASAPTAENDSTYEIRGGLRAARPTASIAAAASDGPMWASAPTGGTKSPCAVLSCARRFFLYNRRNGGRSCRIEQLLHIEQVVQQLGVPPHTVAIEIAAALADIALLDLHPILR